VPPRDDIDAWRSQRPADKGNMGPDLLIRRSPSAAMVVTGMCPKQTRRQDLSQFHSSFQATNHGALSVCITLIDAIAIRCNDVSRHLPTVSRDITGVEPRGLEPLTPCLQSDGVALAKPRSGALSAGEPPLYSAEQRGHCCTLLLYSLGAWRVVCTTCAVADVATVPPSQLRGLVSVS
jgi:hypothetical protein